MAAGVGLADTLVEGVGIAGAPNGGVVSVQGVAGGVPQPIALSGTVDVSDRAARAVGVISGVVSLTGTADVSDRAARAVGVVTIDPHVTTTKTVTPAAGVAVSIVLPATAGKRWVIDSFAMRLMGRGTADIQTGSITSGGALGVLLNQRLSVLATGGDQDQFQYQPGLGLIGDTNATLTLAITAPAAANFVTGNLTAYLIT